MAGWLDVCCGPQFFSLRAKCFFIGYLNLVASTVDLGCHLVILSAVTNFFTCDVNVAVLHSINWSWLEPFLVIINTGTHGFYPFPLVLSYYDSLGVSGQPRCYPGMVHVYLIDLINILIHAIWLKLVVSYITALHNKDTDTMRMFFTLSVIKVVLQLLYFAYAPLHVSMHLEAPFNSYWLVKIIDICVAISFLLLMNRYIKAVKAEKAAPTPAQADDPPSYIECVTLAKELATQDAKTEAVP